MRATYRKTLDGYMPAIEENGKVDVLEGPPLVTIKRALFYAGMEKARRGNMAFRKRERQEA